MRTSIRALLALAVLVWVLLPAAQADDFTSYRLQLELITTSELTRIELEGGTLFVDRWEFPYQARGTVTACGAIEFSKRCCAETPTTIRFDTIVTPDDDTEQLKWIVTKGSIGWAQLYIYPDASADATENPPILLKCTQHNEGRTSCSLSIEKLDGVASTMGFTLESSSDTYRDCENLFDIPYAELPGVDAEFLSLDLFLPPRDLSDPPPLIVWIHGGGWVGGDKGKLDLRGTLGTAYALASINYRLAPDFVSPAQIHDCMAAIRWLRAHAAEYGYDPDWIGVWGASAGGHLAALLGVADGVVDLTGTLGNHLDQSSAVQAVCDYYGPADLLTVGKESDRSEQMSGFVSSLLGGPVEDYAESAVLATPTTHVDPSDAPFLIIHGDADDLVPSRQSEALHEALLASGVSTQLYLIEGAGHAGPTGWSAEILRIVRAFFDRWLAGERTLN